MSIQKWWFGIFIFILFIFACSSDKREKPTGLEQSESAVENQTAPPRTLARIQRKSLAGQNCCAGTDGYAVTKHAGSGTGRRNSPA